MAIIKTGKDLQTTVCYSKKGTAVPGSLSWQETGREQGLVGRLVSGLTDSPVN